MNMLLSTRTIGKFFCAKSYRKAKWLCIVVAVFLLTVFAGLWLSSRLPCAHRPAG
jgi:hypothetical protein